MEEAIRNCHTGETIQLLRSVPFFVSDVPITITEGQEVTLDLAGHNLIVALETMTIQNSGTLTIQNTSASTSTIQSASSNVIINNEGANLTLNNITMTEGKGNSLQNAGTVHIENSTIMDNAVNTGTMYITESTMHTVQNANGTIDLQSGSITSITNSQGNVVQNGGNIHSLQNNEGNVTMLGGTVDGITSTGTVTLGTKDGSVATDTPIITGSGNEIEYGITNNGGQVYFYDGTIKGKTAGVKGKFTELETNTELLVSTETISDVEYEVLILQSVEGPVASIGDTTYVTLQNAIDACADNTQTTITILRDTIVANAEIPSEKQIVLDINGKTITQYQTCISHGTLQITDASGTPTGTITSYAETAIQNTGNLNITNGKIADVTTGINNTGTLEIMQVDIQNTTTAIRSSGTTNISGGTYSNNKVGIAVNAGTTTMTAGSIENNENGVYVTGGTMIASGATFLGNTYASHVNGQNARMTIIEETIFTDNQYGIYIQSGQGFSGIKDTTVNTEAPNIIGTISGIKVDSGGILHFYDGKIQGTVAAIEGYASYLEDGYKVKSETVDSLYTDTLALSGTVQTVARVDDIEFSSIQSAINSCIGDTAKTVTLLNSVTITESIKIEADQKVILDLNKHNIEGNIAGSIIDNAGELTILDTSTEKTGKIINTGGVGIHNTGTLTMGTEDGTVEESIRIEGATKGVETTGTFNYYDGLLAGITPVEGTISNLPTGAVIRTRTENDVTVYYIG